MSGQKRCDAGCDGAYSITISFLVFVLFCDRDTVKVHGRIGEWRRMKWGGRRKEGERKYVKTKT